MLVVHAGWEAAPRFIYGGLGVFLAELSRAEARLGREVVVLGCAPPGVPRKCYDGGGPRVCVACTVYDLGVRNLAEIQYDLAAWRGLLEAADLVVVHDYHLYGAALIAGRAKAYIHTAAGLPEEILLVSRVGEVLTNSALEAGVVAQLMEYASRLNLYGRPSGPRVVHPAAPTPPPRAVEASRERPPGEGRPLRVVALTRNQQNKGLNVLLEGFAEARRRGLDATLVIAGRGIERGARPGVELLGEVGEEEKWLLLAGADIVVYPSSFEPFGLVPLEAAALARPVLISDRVGAGEVLRSAPRFKSGSPESLAGELLRLAREEDLAGLGRRLQAEALARTWADVALEIEGGTG